MCLYGKYMQGKTFLWFSMSAELHLIYDQHFHEIPGKLISIIHIYVGWAEKLMKLKTKTFGNQTNAMILWLHFEEHKKYCINHYNMLGFVCVVQTVENTSETVSKRKWETEKAKYSSFSLYCNFRIQFLEFFRFKSFLCMYALYVALTLFREIYVIECSMLNWLRYATAYILPLSRSKFIVGC